MGWEGTTEKKERQTVFPAPAERLASVAADWSFLGSQDKKGKDGGGGGDDDNGEGSEEEEVSTHNPLYAESNDIGGGGHDGGVSGHPRWRYAEGGMEDN
ncbi:unnamed protein product, partial [Ectocarpus fasciculatus]